VPKTAFSAKNPCKKALAETPETLILAEREEFEPLAR